ncbi:MFS transporter [Streptomyces sp. NPDC051976]|uniref:MFS transporter n=1 Tax=Streptomyces sp. NPDC051976 TaxID=3154947 RepID=UPI0034323B10
MSEGSESGSAHRRTVLLCGMAAFTLATALCAAAQGFTSMLLCRFLGGTSAAFVSPQIWAAIPQTVPTARIARTMALATAGLSVSQVVGIPAGAWLALLSWRAPFWVVSAGAAAVWVLLLKSFPSLPPAASAGGSGRRGVYADVLGRGPLRLLLAGYLVFQTGNFAAIASYGSWFTRDFAMDQTSVGAAMMALGTGNTAGALLGARLVRRLGPRRALAAPFVAVACLHRSRRRSPRRTGEHLKGRQMADRTSRASSAPGGTGNRGAARTP